MLTNEQVKKIFLKFCDNISTIEWQILYSWHTNIKW